MERKVVVAGWSQVIQPKIIDTIALDPLGLMNQACHQAIARLSRKNDLVNIDGLMIVRTVSHHYETPASDLARSLEIRPKFTQVSGIGGNSPQTLINIASGMIARNEVDSVMICGAEAYVQREPNHKQVESALFRGIPSSYEGDDLIGSTPLENRHGIEHPMHGFPLYETALWSASGMNIDDYLLKIGKTWSSFSQTAVNNPYAWSKQFRTPEEIITQSPQNRPIAFPYTKYLNSFVTVDQGAAVLLMAEELAKKHSRKTEKTVYFLGGGYAEDRQRFMIEKSDFTTSPPLKDAVQKALERSHTSVDELDCFDLYSCFPCAVTIGKKMIGISDDDQRPLTLTGGLGFFGGPGNNYSLHSIATLAGKIAIGERTKGLITALGWFMHKHAAGIYSATPSNSQFKDYDIQDQANPLSGDKPIPIEDRVTGPGTIETYTIIYNTDQTPQYAVIYGRTKSNSRFIARTESKIDIFETLRSKTCIGKKVKLSFDKDKNINIAELV